MKHARTEMILYKAVFCKGVLLPLCCLLWDPESCWWLFVKSMKPFKSISNNSQKGFFNLAFF